MISYKVTWVDTITGRTRSMEARATSIEGARKEEEFSLRFLQMRNPALQIQSIEVIA